MITEKTARAIASAHDEMAMAKAMLAKPDRLVLSDNFERRHLPVSREMAAQVIEGFLARKEADLADLMVKAAAELATPEPQQ